MDITVYLSKFLSTLSLRRATAIVLMRAATQRIFLSTLSLRRATAPAQRSTLKESDFYPRSPCGERLFHFNHTILIQCISIHALLAESDATAAPGITACHIISIHALLAESDQTVTKWASSAKISIHALLAESDKSSWSLTRLNRNISIHALLAESDRTQSASLSL